MRVQAANFFDELDTTALELDVAALVAHDVASKLVANVFLAARLRREADAAKTIAIRVREHLARRTPTSPDIGIPFLEVKNALADLKLLTWEANRATFGDVWHESGGVELDVDNL